MKGREQNCCWHFDNESGLKEGPNNALEMHFAAASKKESYSNLIRESIQNSMDAVLDKSKPVRVKIEMFEMGSRSYPNFFELKQHIQGCVDEWGEQAERFKSMLDYFGDEYEDVKMGCLKVTDSNTTGMEYREDDNNCAFSAFAFTTGLNAKADENAGGAFGFGKTAFFLLSPIRTVFVSSRYGNDKSVFIGTSHLCTHSFNEQLKTSVGFYGNKVENEDKVVPVTEFEEIPVKFRLSERGSSVSIIGVDVGEKAKQAAKKEMLKATLRNYWLAIWEGKLVVEIFEETIDKNSIAKLMEDSFPSDYNESKSIKKNKYNPRPYFDAVRFANQSEECLLKQDKLQDIGEAELYIRKTPGNRDVVVYMRNNLMFIFSKKRTSHYGYHALFVCRGERGNKILRDLENPAHDSWDEKWRIQKYNLDPDSLAGRLGKDVLNTIEDFITTTTESIFHSENAESMSITGLDKYLYIDDSFSSNDHQSIQTNAEASSDNPSGEKPTDGSAPEAVIEGDANIENGETENVGHVIVTSAGRLKPNPKSTRVAGAGHIHSGGGPRPKAPRASSNFTPADIDAEGDGTLGECIPVRYRVVAQTNGGVVFHDIIFDSPKEAEQGAIDIVVGGEQADEIPQILRTDRGMVSRNCVTGLHIKTGKNKVRIHFADNLKHAIKLKAYETK